MNKFSFRIQQPMFYLTSVFIAFLAGVALAPKSPAPVSNAPQPGDISNNTAMVYGDPEAKVKVVEYADPLCPYCVNFGVDTEIKLRKEYMDTGKVQFEYKPVAMISKNSDRAVQGLFCAADQKKFWPFLDEVHRELKAQYAKGEKGDTVTIFESGEIGGLASKAGLDGAALRDCVDSGEHATSVVKATGEASGFRIQSTPTFYVNGRIYGGATDYNVLETLVKSYL